jgi:hypothetical protein
LRESHNLDEDISPTIFNINKTLDQLEKQQYHNNSARDKIEKSPNSSINNGDVKIIKLPS